MFVVLDLISPFLPDPRTIIIFGPAGQAMKKRGSFSLSLFFHSFFVALLLDEDNNGDRTNLRKNPSALLGCQCL
jgi:hypothetical protein